MEIIKSIQKVTFTKGANKHMRVGMDYKPCVRECDYDGFQITTDKQIILIGIENQQDCCEDWGYIISEDNLEDFINSQFLKIETVDTGYNVKIVNFIRKKYNDNTKKDKERESKTVFVNITTNVGVLQFVAYNYHNGYYGHSVYLESEQLSINKDI